MCVVANTSHSHALLPFVAVADLCCEQISPEQHSSFKERSAKGQYFIFPVGRVGKDPGSDDKEGEGSDGGSSKEEKEEAAPEGTGSGFMVLLSQAQDGKHVLLTWLEEFRLDPSKAPSYMTATFYPELEESKGVGECVCVFGAFALLAELWGPSGSLDVLGRATTLTHEPLEHTRKQPNERTIATRHTTHAAQSSSEETSRKASSRGSRESSSCTSCSTPT